MSILMINLFGEIRLSTSIHIVISISCSPKESFPTRNATCQSSRGIDYANLNHPLIAYSSGKLFTVTITLLTSLLVSLYISSSTNVFVERLLTVNDGSGPYESINIFNIYFLSYRLHLSR